MVYHLINVTQIQLSDLGNKSRRVDKNLCKIYSKVMTSVGLFLINTGIIEIWVRSRCAPMIAAALGSQFLLFLGQVKATKPSDFSECETDLLC